MTPKTNNWSEELQQQTRDAISEIRVSPYDGNLHFKNSGGCFAFMTIQDLLGGKLSLTDKENGQVFEFADLNELLNAGWAMD